MYRTCKGKVSFVCFKKKTAYDMRISDWSSDVCSSALSLPAGAMGQIVGNDLCGLFHRRKTIARMRRHETDHAGDAARFHLRCDVDKRQRSETSRCAVSLGDEPGQATQ